MSCVPSFQKKKNSTYRPNFFSIPPKQQSFFSSWPYTPLPIIYVMIPHIGVHYDRGYIEMHWLSQEHPQKPYLPDTLRQMYNTSTLCNFTLLMNGLLSKIWLEKVHLCRGVIINTYILYDKLFRIRIIWIK